MLYSLPKVETHNHVLLQYCFHLLETECPSLCAVNSKRNLPHLLCFCQVVFEDHGYPKNQLTLVLKPCLSCAEESPLDDGFHLIILFVALKDDLDHVQSSVVIINYSYERLMSLFSNVLGTNLYP